ncbi:MAG: hypothetical protein WD906_06490 [Anaerolineales bacterium]
MRRQPPFNRRSLKFFTGNTAFHTGRARTALGFEASTELEEGLARTGAWLRASGLLGTKAG